MNKILVSLIAVLVTAVGYSADLTIDSQFNLAGKDQAKNYLSFKGLNGAVEKDQFDAAKVVDGATGASKLNSTVVFNAYRTDVKGKKPMPVSFRYFLLYGVASDSIRESDAPGAVKNADGSITIRYIHRGTAIEFSTDKTGKLVFPTLTAKNRKIGHTDNTISTDFSSTGKVADVDWKKVWDDKIVDGKIIGTTTSKTGKVTIDAVDSDIFTWAGALQVTLNGTIIKINGELNAVKK